MTSLKNDESSNGYFDSNVSNDMHHMDILLNKYITIMTLIFNEDLFSFL